MRDDPSFYIDAEAGHLDDAALTAFVSGAMGDARGSIVAHLAACAHCRRAVASVSRALGDADVHTELTRLGRPAWVRPRWIAVGLAAAAAVVVLIGPFRERGTGAPDRSTLRAAREGLTPPALVSPGEGQSAPAESVLFVWRDIGRDVEYRLTVTDERGDIIWTRPSSDTTARPDRALLSAGHGYFWYVDALFPDGRSASSGARQLRIAP